MGDRLRGRRRTLESGSWARQASRTPSEICGMVWGGCLVSGASETRRDDRGGRDTSASPRLVFAIPSGEKATVRVERERPNRQTRDHAPGPRACRGDPVDRLGGEEESGTVLGSHLRRVRWSRRGGRGSVAGRRDGGFVEEASLLATDTKNAIASAGAPETRDCTRRGPVPRRRREARRRRSGRTLRRCELEGEVVRKMWPRRGETAGSRRHRSRQKLLSRVCKQRPGKTPAARASCAPGFRSRRAFIWNGLRVFF